MSRKQSGESIPSLKRPALLTGSADDFINFSEIPLEAYFAGKTLKTDDRLIWADARQAVGLKLLGQVFTLVTWTSH